MKKLTLMFFTVALCFPAFSQQKVKVVKVDPDTTGKEIVQYRVRANHWSIMGSIGAGWLDGDQIQKKDALFPNTFVKLNGLVNVEYTFNPIWGIYLEYLYNSYGGWSMYRNDNARNAGLDFRQDQWNPTPGNNYKFQGINHEITLGASINILNLFYGCRPQHVNWYANGGVGISLFDLKSLDMSDAATGNLTSIDVNNKAADPLGIIPNKNYALTFPVGTTVEWNVTRWLAVLANIKYSFHTEDYYDASVRGNNNDGSIFMGLGLRWKINSLKHRNYQHVRDMAMCQYEPNMTAELARQAIRKVDSLKPRVDDLENKVKDLEPRVKALENNMDNLRDSDGDGVPDIRDREPNTPQGVPVNQFGEADYSGIPDNKYYGGDNTSPIVNTNNVNPNGIPNWKLMGPNDDLDGDGIPNAIDPDIDGDGIPNAKDPTPYGLPPFISTNPANPADNMYLNGDKTKPIKNPSDINGDGIPNWKQMGPNDDMDGDGIPNALDPDIDGDGIPNEKDQTPYGMLPSNATSSTDNGDCIKIFFSTAKYDISAASQTELASVANKLAAFPELKLQINSFADQQGAKTGYNNQKLTDNRAKQTRDILIKRYGVDPKRIIMVKGNGAIPGPTIDYLPNRNSTMCFVK